MIFPVHIVLGTKPIFGIKRQIPFFDRLCVGNSGNGRREVGIVGQRRRLVENRRTNRTPATNEERRSRLGQFCDIGQHKLDFTFDLYAMRRLGLEKSHRNRVANFCVQIVCRPLVQYDFVLR